MGIDNGTYVFPFVSHSHTEHMMLI